MATPRTRQRHRVYAAIGVVAVLLTGCTDAAAPPEPPAPSTATTLEDLDLPKVRVLREPFCEYVRPEAVEAALGSEATGASTYANGDRAAMSSGLEDVTHEHGCTWTGEERAVARAWVFVPPVRPARAREIGRARVAGCEREAAGLGRESVAWTCEGARTTTVRMAGLLGDGWLTCELTVASGTDLDQARARLDPWCAAVVNAAS